MNNKPVNYAQGGRGGAPPPQPMYNPPAFPTSHEEPSDYNGHNNSKKIVIDQGMTLRDYMAAKAMSGILTDTGWMGNTVNTLANMSYEVADAMLKAREA